MNTLTHTAEIGESSVHPLSPQQRDLTAEPPGMSSSGDVSTAGERGGGAEGSTTPPVKPERRRNKKGPPKPPTPYNPAEKGVSALFLYLAISHVHVLMHDNACSSVLLH